MEDKIFKRKEHKSFIHSQFIWECKLMQPLGKTVWMFLQKLKIELPYDLASPLLSIYPKEMKMGYQKAVCTPC